MNPLVRIDICICTFRRAHVADTISSLARLELRPEWKLRLIVADNDDMPSARAIVDAAAATAHIDLTYIHAPARNISIARNACLDAATAPYVAFLDDDEIASPQWLAAMMEELDKSGAGAVLGPVKAIYRPECPTWLLKADYHSLIPAAGNNQVVTGGTGNVLFRRAALGSLRFRKNLGRSGGEDTAFFRDLALRGCRVSLAPNAIVTEAVSRERESFGWLVKRRFRSGQTHGLLLLESCGANPSGRAKNAAISASKAAFCFVMAAVNALRGNRSRFWALRGALHAGATSRLLGRRELELYG